MTQSVLILGAGELGLAVLEALSKHTLRDEISKLSVAVRRSTIESDAGDKKRSVERIRSLGATLEGTDLAAASVDELAPMLSRYDTVICCTGMDLPAGTQVKIARAVLQARVPRYFPWQFGVDYDVIGQGSSQDLFDEQLAVRALLRGQDATRWTIVSTGVFMSFLVEPAFGIVDLASRTVRALGSWGARITATTPEGIGRVTADVIITGNGSRDTDGIVYAAGDTVSYRELADAVDAQFGPPAFEREVWDADALEEQLQQRPDDGIVKYRETFARGVGVAWDLERTINHQRGMEMCDVKTYLASLGRRP
ncbi:Glutamyl-tRNA reductase [Geosmithia morbida]|uniref:Glutamyl-tRNA reductase n=1 Tax=Geosmithia morbida TaxID=1094350 RepID=A0A9P4YLT3_9HYPO|nr:Glutamyl-tRNA reductase [Geosmithia morbida]KAF4119333.1 Glutamyl-tRNA reductase [Geosmithia morbida]